MTIKKLFKTMKIACIITAIVFVAGAVIGTLAIPVVLAINVSMYWLFLYAGYALMVLYVVLYCIRYWNTEGGTTK